MDMIFTLVCVFLMTALGLGGIGPRSNGWRQLEPGMEVRMLEAHNASPVGDSQITVVRFDPALWRLVFMGLTNTGEPHGLTAREWCQRYHLTAAINAGMFNDDYRTHTGFLLSKNDTNSAKVNKYQSVVAFDPVRPDGVPPFRIFDLDVPEISIEGILRDYRTAVQNLRLIKHPGQNRWSQQSKMWSEAALGEDSDGRILFIFTRSPFTMHDLNLELLSAGIGIVAAQHLEGGPEAQLYFEAGGEKTWLFGSYETGFQEDDMNDNPWPVPNVFVIRPRR